jgi:prolyl oligopeptidase
VIRLVLLLLAAAALDVSALDVPAQEDPYLWLEDVSGDKALAWVREQNALTERLADEPGFKALNERLLAIYTSRERIPWVKKRGKWLYNYWQDERNPRGVLRRATLDEYRKKSPEWETVIDFGRLSAEEGERWVFKGATCLYPDYARCMISLSRLGSDAVELREFDVDTGRWVKDGFRTGESKQDIAWKDANTLYIARDFGPGTMTTSGYPRQVREWSRGTTLSSATLAYEALPADVGAWPIVVNEPGRTYERVRRAIDTRLGEEFLRVDGRWVRLETPRDADVSIADGRLLVRLRTDWHPRTRTFAAGSLIACDLDDFLRGEREFDTVFEPRPRVSLQDYAATRGYLVLDVLDNVKGRVIEAWPPAKAQTGTRTAGPGKWLQREVEVPGAASTGIAAFDRDEGDAYWLTVTSFVDPTSVYLVTAGAAAREKVKSAPAFFDAKGLKVEQREATSRDGTRIPYFVVMREGTKLDGHTPTILYGYGAFEISMAPMYNATAGAAWLERGGAWVLANIRGGGEFGPAWHLAAMREGRHLAHEDFIAVAEDVIKAGITSPPHLGILGGSQGGLLVGAALTQRPELFGAAVSFAPLLDMKRYHKLLAGASWMGEYGNPDDPKDWEFLSKYSPYQNVVKERKYPKVLFSTSTRDDRVHPGHARKMYAKMKDQGHDVMYFEYLEGGHSAGSLPAQQAYTWALIYTVLGDALGLR